MGKEGRSILGSENSQFKDPKTGACSAHSNNSKGNRWNKCKGLKGEGVVQRLQMGGIDLFGRSGFLEATVS